MYYNKDKRYYNVCSISKLCGVNSPTFYSKTNNMLKYSSFYEAPEEKEDEIISLLKKYSGEKEYKNYTTTNYKVVELVEGSKIYKVFRVIDDYEVWIGMFS